MPVAAEPSLEPRWATSPPAGPPDYVTEPTEPEKDRGWYPPQARVVRVNIDNVVNATLYRVTINGTNCDYTSDGSALNTEIRDGLVAAINAAVGAAVTATNDGSAAVDVTADVPGTTFSISEASANMSLTELAENRTGRPRRQYMNWLQWLAYLWIHFLQLIRFRWSDIGNDWHVPAASTAPTIGAGLVGTTGGDTAYILGRRVVGDNAAHTYSDNVDTYIDLDRDGVFHFTAVANAAAAPAVFANSIRCFMLRTVAGARTAVTNLTATVGDRPRVDVAFDLNSETRFGDSRRGSLAQRSETRRRTRYTGAGDPLFAGGGAGYTHVETFDSDSGSQYASHLYIRHATGGLVVVVGARWNGAQWVSASGGANVVTMEPLGIDAWSATSVLFTCSTSPFNDSEFFAAEAAGGLLKQSIQGGTLGAGAGRGTTAYERGLPAFRAIIPSTDRTPALEAGGDFRIFGVGTVATAGGTDGATRGGEMVRNATWDPATQRWARIVAGDAWKLEITSVGLRLLRHAAGDASPWADTVAAGTWVEIFTGFGWLSSTQDIQTTASLVGDRASITNLAAAGTLHLSAAEPATPLSHTLYRDTIPKCFGFVVTNGSGGFTGGTDLFGCSVAMAGFDVQVTMDVAMLNPRYAICPNWGEPDSRDVKGVISSTTVFTLQVFTDAGVHVDLNGGTYHLSFAVFGRHP